MPVPTLALAKVAVYPLVDNFTLAVSPETTPARTTELEVRVAAVVVS